jgi:hypothetical protein
MLLSSLNRLDVLLEGMLLIESKRLHKIESKRRLIFKFLLGKKMSSTFH